MVARAKAARVALPASFLQQVKDSQRETATQVKEDAALVAKRASSRVCMLAVSEYIKSLFSHMFG